MLAGRYKGVIWQLYNEEDNTSIAADATYGLGGCFGTAPGGIPNSVGRIIYARTIEAASAAVRATDSTAQIAMGGVASDGFVSPSGGAFDQGFLPGVLAQLKADSSLASLDYVDVHYYSSQAGTYRSAGTDLLGRLNQLRQDILAAGLTPGELKQVISDELGYTDTIGTSSTDPTYPFNIAQRAYLPKVYSRAAAANLRAAFWFFLQDVNGQDNAYGLKDATGAPKPSYAAMRYFNSIVKTNTQFARTLALGGVSPKLEGYEFTAAAGASLVQIVWNQTDSTLVPYGPIGAIVSVTDPSGAAVAWSGNTVSVGSEPRYITYTAATPTPTATASPTSTITPTPSPTATLTPTAIPTQTGGNLITTLAAPVRLADTRLAGGAIASGSSQCFQVAGVGGVPTDAGAVVLNITAIGYNADGWLTAYPNGQAVPSTSILNFGTSEYAIANGSILRVGAGGQVCMNVGSSAQSSSGSQVILDAVGYLPGAALNQLVMLPSPVRASDTRLGAGLIANGSSGCFPLAGAFRIPSDAAAVVLNVTAVGYATSGWLTAFPAGQAVPGTSTLNFDQSEYAIANNAIVRIGSAGAVCVNVGTLNSVSGGSQVIVDVTGYLTAGALAKLPMLSSPQRVLDTRLSGGAIQGGTSRCFTIAGLAGIPANARVVAVNVTAVGYTTAGWLTTYPSGQAVPSTSTLNFDVNEYALGNGAIVALGGDGKLCVNIGTLGSAPGGSQVIIDAVGYAEP